MQNWKAVLRSLRREMIAEERRQVLADANREYLALSPAQGLLNLAKKTGQYKGEVLDITPGQFRATLGYSPKRAVMNSKGYVPWEYCFDQLATERGLSSDYELKREIEFALKLKHSLERRPI